MVNYNSNLERLLSHSTPSYHPFIAGIFLKKTKHFWIPPLMETPKSQLDPDRCTSPPWAPPVARSAAPGREGAHPAAQAALDVLTIHWIWIAYEWYIPMEDLNGIFFGDISWYFIGIFHWDMNRRSGKLWDVPIQGGFSVMLRPGFHWGQGAVWGIHGGIPWGHRRSLIPSGYVKIAIENGHW